LVEASNILKNVEGISFQYFDEQDVVRHQLVQRIIRAYDEHKTKNDQQLSLGLDTKPANGKKKSELPAAVLNDSTPEDGLRQ